MANRYVREIGSVEDIDGARLFVGVDHGTVVIAFHRIGPAELADFTQLLATATFQAGQDEQRIAEEAGV